MASGYVRQAAGNIASNLAIRAADLNAEYNQLQSAFDNTIGHDHSGSVTGDGAKIPLASAVSGILPVANGGTGSASSYLPCPNILINSSMEIDQVNEGAAVSLTTGANFYVIDNWSAGITNASAVVTAQRVVDAPPGFTNSLKITVSTGGAVVAGSYIQMYQLIEANNITQVDFGDAGAKTLSLSFWVKSSIGSYTMCGVLRNSTINRTYPFNISITSPNTWEQKSIIIPADTAGAWVTTGTGVGASIALVPATGSTFQGTANTWAGSNLLGTSSCTNTILSTNGATFQVTGVKLEISPSVTTYLRKSFLTELIECQRYYEKSYDLGTVAGGITGTGITVMPTWSATNGIYIMPVGMRVTKRTTPTVTIYSPTTGASGRINNFTGGSADVIATAANIGTNQFFINPNALTPANGNRLEAHWTADSRL